MKTVGIEKRSAILYSRIRPSLKAWFLAECKKAGESPNAYLEKIFEVCQSASSNPQKPRSRT